MRIVSLLPAATEWICAFGGEDDLVGRSHECDFPPSVQDRPVVTEATFESADDSAAIDEAVQQQIDEGLSLYAVDLERLRALEPDLIVTQAQCDVCAVSMPQLEAALDEWVGGAPQVVSMTAMTLKEVLDEALQLGQALQRADAAMAAIARREKKLKVLRDRLGIERRTDPETLPTIACIEWMDPLMTAGHWMPDLVDMAGGRAVLSESGTRSQYVDWAEIRAADPEVLAIIPCGFTLDETHRDLSALTDRPGWDDLQAVRTGRVFLFDGNAYFNRPGPRLYRSIELLARALHPAAREAVPAEAWEQQNYRAAAAKTP